MNNKFIKGTLILLIGSLFTKLLAMFIKIYYTRLLGTEGIGYISIINPTYSLLMTIAVFSLPNTLSFFIAKSNSTKKIILTTIQIILLLDFLYIAIMIIISPTIASKLLHNNILYYPIVCISLTIPFITLSAIIKGYFFGNQNMFPYAISNFLEQLFRLLLITIFIPNLIMKNVIYGICGLFLINIFTELFSIFIFSFFMPKKIKISIQDLKIDFRISKDVILYSLPFVSSRIVGNISYFFEPIVLINSLLELGYNNHFIMHEYGVINGYIIPLLLFPTFILSSITTSLIPEISRLLKKNNINKIKVITKNAILLCLSGGIIINIIIFIYSDKLLYLLFHTIEGLNYLPYLLIIFPLYYLEAPLTAIIQVIGNPKHSLKITIIGCTIKLLLIFILSKLYIGIYCLIIAEMINIVIVVLLELLYVNNCFKKDKLCYNNQ